jgi:hypothetical protein
MVVAGLIRVSQDAFDDVVRENMEEFDMPEEEAVADAVAQFTMQGVDLSNIVQSTVADRAAHPVGAGCPAAPAASDACAAGGAGARPSRCSESDRQRRGGARCA